MLSSYERKILSKINFLQKKSVSNKSRLYKNGGIDFRQLRDYVYSDDFRSIDWKSSARTQKLVVKEFIELISVEIFLVLDLTKSTNLGAKCPKTEILKKAFYALAWRALQQKCQINLAFILENEFFFFKLSTEQDLSNIYFNINNLELCLTKLSKSLPKTLGAFVEQSARGKLIIVSDFLDERLINLKCNHRVLGIRYRDTQDFKFINYPGYVADPENYMPKFIDYAGPNITKISQKLKDFWQSVDQLWKNSNRQIIDLDDKDLIYRLVKSLEDKL
jgi:hypothetical protein